MTQFAAANPNFTTGTQAKKIGVLFIVGYGRSGSTLLDCMLGQVDNHCSVGEINFLWKYCFSENRLCGCGKPFRECPFWRAVIDEAFGGFECVDVAHLTRMSEDLYRWRNFPALLLPRLAGRRFRERLSEYRRVIERLYLVIAKTSGRRVIVDSSKHPLHGLIMGGIRDIDLRVIHLIRDSRAVAHSWRCTKLKTDFPSENKYFRKRSAVRVAITWSVWNMLGFWLRSRAPRGVQVRYEDLVQDVHATLADISAVVMDGRSDLEFVSGGLVNLCVTHTAGGNSGRLESGKIAVRPNDEWLYKMSQWRRIFVTVLTWPLLRLWGYSTTGA